MLKIIHAKFEPKQISQSGVIIVRIPVQNQAQIVTSSSKYLIVSLRHRKGIMLKIIYAKFEIKQISQSGFISVRIPVP